MNYLSERVQKRYTAESLCYTVAGVKKYRENSLLITGCPSNYYVKNSHSLVSFKTSHATRDAHAGTWKTEWDFIPSMPEKHRSTVHRNYLLGMRFVLSVFSLAAPVGSRGGRNAERSREERSRRGICVTARRGHRQTGPVLKNWTKIRKWTQSSFHETWNIMQVSL